MPPQVRTVLTIVITLAVLAGFAALFCWGIYATWTATAKPVFPETYLYVATALAGLVGGIVAAGFGQKLPESSAVTRPSRMARNITALGNFVLAGQAFNAQQIVASIYAGVYVLLGLVAIITWVVKADVTSDLVKSLASVAFGLFLAIAQTFFHEPQ